jgi:hypothetical protein
MRVHTKHSLHKRSHRDMYFMCATKLHFCPPQSLNSSLLMILRVYDAENWNIDAGYISLHFTQIIYRPPDSPWSTFQAAFT